MFWIRWKRGLFAVRLLPLCTSNHFRFAVQLNYTETKQGSIKRYLCKGCTFCFAPFIFWLQRKTPRGKCIIKGFLLLGGKFHTSCLFLSFRHRFSRICKHFRCLCNCRKAERTKALPPTLKFFVSPFLSLAHLSKFWIISGGTSF